jgi:hypothetical protein
MHSITFSEFTNEVKNASKSMYFGNCTGSDLLKGKDIAVVGCPHLPVVVYALYAAVMGTQLSSADLVMGDYRVRRNGYEFSIKTFSNQFLRTIQFYCIESELVQAVGRARLIRTAASVTLFSRYPLPTFSKIEIVNKADGSQLINWNGKCVL